MMKAEIKKMDDSLSQSWIDSGSGYQKTVLDNGIRVITEEIPYLRSVSIGVWVVNGSRDEKPNENGRKKGRLLISRRKLTPSGEL
jgi:hypothetical protein